MEVFDVHGLTLLAGDILAAPKPKTNEGIFPGWVQAAALYLIIALIFGAIMVSLKKAKNPHTGWAIFTGVLALLSYTASAAALATKSLVASFFGVGKTISSTGAEVLRDNGWPVTVGGLLLTVALICGVVFLFRKSQGAAIGLGLAFGIFLFLSADFFPFVSKLLTTWYNFTGAFFG